MSRSCNANLRLRGAAAAIRICGSAESEPKEIFSAPNIGSRQSYIDKTVLALGTYFDEKYYTQQRLQFHILEVQIHQLPYIRPQLLTQQEIKLSTD
jgi:hypothetical protein